MDKNEIKRANRKAMPKFLLFTAVGMVVGGIMGYLFTRYGFGSLSGSMRSAGEFFGAHTAHLLMLAMAIVVPAVCTPLYLASRRLIGSWDGEDETVYAEIDRRLSAVIWISGAALILSFFLIAATYAYGFAPLENGGSISAIIIGIAAFVAVLVESIVFNQKCVDAAKLISPEKTASVYDMKFQKKWMDSCDEAEKLVIGKCAFKAYSATNLVCMLLSIVLAVCALEFDIGLLPSLAVCLVWLVNYSVYCREAIRYSRAGVKLG